MATLTIEKTGRRFYVLGNTYSIKDQLRSEGCNWDPGRKAWWTGKQEVAERLQNATPQPASSGLDTEVCGRATYKGKSYYIVWHGRTKRGDYAAKLCFRDGSKEFWAKEMAEFRVTKEYRAPRTIRSLQEFAEKRKNESPEDRSDRDARQWAYQEHGGICRCANPVDEGGGECMLCGYGMV
mgnify:CR=1 FL=1